MRTIIITLIAIATLCSISLTAQVPHNLQWTMQEPSTTAQTFLWVWTIDGGAAQSVTTPVTCTGGGPSTCTTAIPSLAAGVRHTIILWAISAENFEGGHSAPFPFSIPSTPTGLRAI